MLPDYMIRDELERMRREREAEAERQDDRPRLEVPRYMPLWPEDYSEESEAEEGTDRGVVIIQM